MENLYSILKRRNFIYDTTDEDAVTKLLESERVVFYIGFDPTADSFHVGSLLPIMAMKYLQMRGHKPIAILGGGTAMIGDPSGKTEMRKMLTKEQIKRNQEALKKQLERFVVLDGEKGMLLNNASWLEDLNYIDFLREIGVHFSVNRMLTAESYRMRLEKGLSFLEFNYMLLQAYDFYYLFKNYNCVLQIGGQDQWGNMVAGIDLIRRKLGKQAYAITLPLLLNSSGQKFGKTEKGAIWLDAKKTSPYEFYQFFRNCDDRDVEKLMLYFTFLPEDEISYLASLKDKELNRAKEILGYEVTKLVHGKEEAKKAYLASISKFGESDPEGKVKTSSDIKFLKEKKEEFLPTVYVTPDEIEAGIPVLDLYVKAGLCKSKAEARRLVVQGGARINDKRVTDFKYIVTENDFKDSFLILKAGKKKLKRVGIKG